MHKALSQTTTHKYCHSQHGSFTDKNQPSGLYCAIMVTVCPAFFSAMAACSCVAFLRSTPLTWEGKQIHWCPSGSAVRQAHLPLDPFSHQIDTYREDLVPFPELSTEVCWSPGQDEGDEDPLSVFAPHNVEAQPG